MSANFTPSQSAIKDLKPFRFWCQKVLPTVYDDSLSYYELLTKVVNYLNDTIDNVEALNDNVQNIYDAYILLQNYVNDYFDQNFPRLVSDKLDEMAEDGTLTALISAYIDPYFEEKSAEIEEAFDAQNDRIGDAIESQNDTISEAISDQNDVLSAQTNSINQLTSRMDAFVNQHSGLSGETLLYDGSGTPAYTTGSYLALSDALANYKYLRFVWKHRGEVCVQDFEIDTEETPAQNYNLRDTISAPAVQSGGSASWEMCNIVVINATNGSTNQLELGGATVIDNFGYNDGPIDGNMNTGILKVIGIKDVSDTEVVDARVGADGTIYSTLEERLNAENSELKSALTAIENTEVHVSPNLLNFNDPDFLTGKYVNKGVQYNSASYNTSGYIPVEVGKTYHLTYGVPIGTYKSMRFIDAYDEDKQVIVSECKENVSAYEVPNGVTFIRFSASSDKFAPPIPQTNVPCMFYEGASIGQYYEYFEPYYTYTIKNDALDADYLNDLINAKIVNVLTDYGLYIEAKADSMTSADTLTAVQNIDNKKNAVIGFYAEFDSFDSVIIGHGFNVNSGNKAVIDNTYLTVYYGSSEQQMSQVAHGLTISDFIRVTITQNNGGRAKIHIVTATGDYTLSDCSWSGCRADVFAKTGGALTGCVLTAVFKDFNEKLFLFGDSYVSMGDPARYPYYLVQQGYTHLLIDGWGGRNSAQALISFNNVIAKAVPKCAVWALGMNDADTSNAVNASWLTCVQSFIDTCEQNGVTPILATIPNCPTQLNTFKNAWVKASGYRYVDFAKAVGAESAGSSWYTGMLSNDNVHPTALGAKALYARFITDVPEVIK